MISGTTGPENVCVSGVGRQRPTLQWCVTNRVHAVFMFEAKDGISHDRFDCQVRQSTLFCIRVRYLIHACSFAAFTALIQPQDRIMGLGLPDGESAGRFRPRPRTLAQGRFVRRSLDSRSLHRQAQDLRFLHLLPILTIPGRPKDRLHRLRRFGQERQPFQAQDCHLRWIRLPA